MNFMFEKIQRYAALRAIVYVLIGFLIILEPNQVFNVIVYIVAAYVALSGLIQLYQALKDRRQTGYVGFQLIGGIFLLIAALGILIFAKAILSIIPFFLGLLIVLSGGFKLMQSLNLRRAGYGTSGWFVYSILLIVVGIVFIFNPFRTWIVLFQMFGLILLIMGFSEIVTYFQERRR